MLTECSHATMASLTRTVQNLVVPQPTCPSQRRSRPSPKWSEPVHIIDLVRVRSYNVPMATPTTTMRFPSDSRAGRSPAGSSPGVDGNARGHRKRKQQAARKEPDPTIDLGGFRYTDEQYGMDLRRTRERRGLSKRTVAKALGVPQSVMTKVENGSHDLTSEETKRLADIYGCPEYELLSPDEEFHMVDLSAALHQTLPTLRHDREAESAIMRMVHACNEGVGIRLQMGRPRSPELPKHTARMAGTTDAVSQGEDVARKERDRLGLGIAPLANIAALLNSEDVWSAAVRLPDDLSGLFLWHPTVGAAVLVNVGHPPERRNFSYAHEYAHALFDRDGTVTATRRENGSDLGEMRANAFAAAFLMPPDGVASQLDRMGKGPSIRRGMADPDVVTGKQVDVEGGQLPDPFTITPHDIVTLARRFCVSHEAMIWRLQRLGHITPEMRTSLLDGAALAQEYAGLLEPQESGAADPRQDSGEAEFRYHLMHMALEAFRMEVITGGRLRQAAWKLSLSHDIWNLALEMFDAE